VFIHNDRSTWLQITQKIQHSHTMTNCDDTRGNCPGHRNIFRRRLRIAWSAAAAAAAAAEQKRVRREFPQFDSVAHPNKQKMHNYTHISLSRDWTSISDTLVLFGCSFIHNTHTHPHTCFRVVEGQRTGNVTASKRLLRPHVGSYNMLLLLTLLRLLLPLNEQV